MRNPRILVCGGRDFTDHARVYSVLSYYHAECGGFAVIIHGAARGADTFAGDWAKWFGVPVEPYPVTPLEWAFKGKRAGHDRNAKMLREGKPDVVIAFPGERGTANMVEQARCARVSIVEVPR